MGPALCDARRMRPGRDDIALPPFPPGMSWIGAAPKAGERLTARGPLLVNFFEVGVLSSVRTLPFIGGLAETYAASGLSVLGVHSPRSGLAASDDDLASALRRLKVTFPVANDDAHRSWHAYGCEGWPSTFLWGRGGTLAWVHFGEGAYHETEGAVREELGGDPGELPAAMLVEPRSEPGPGLIPPSEEIFPGGAHDRPWRPEGPSDALTIDYSGAGAWASLGGRGAIAVSIDGGREVELAVDAPGLYELSGHGAHGDHNARIAVRGEVRVWSVAATPGTRG
jgi:hypothetical protein